MVLKEVHFAKSKNERAKADQSIGQLQHSSYAPRTKRKRKRKSERESESVDHAHTKLTCNVSCNCNSSSRTCLASTCAGRTNSRLLRPHNRTFTPAAAAIVDPHSTLNSQSNRQTLAKVFSSLSSLAETHVFCTLSMDKVVSLSLLCYLPLTLFMSFCGPSELQL